MSQNKFNNNNNVPAARPIGQPAQDAQGKAKDAVQKTDRAAEIGASIASFMASMAKVLAPVALLLIAIAIGVFAATQIFDLFTTHLSQPDLWAALAVASSVGIAYVMIITMKGWKHPSVQAAATLFAVVYVFITFAMVVLKWIFDAAAQNANITVKAVAQNVLKTAPFLRDFGSLFVVALVGVGLACIAVLVATSKNPPEEFEHENRARSHLVSNLVKIIVSLTSIGLVVLFGAEVLKINIFVVMLLAVILDAGMINAYLRAESAARAGDHRQAGVWRVWAAIYGSVVALVAVETVSHFAANSPDLGAQQKALLEGWVFQLLKDIGLLALCGAVAMSVVQLLFVLFSYTNQRKAEDKDKGIYKDPPARSLWGGVVRKPAGAQIEHDKPADPQLTAGMAADGVVDGWNVQELKMYPGGVRYWRDADGLPVDVVAIPERRPNWSVKTNTGYIEREADSVPAAKAAALAAAKEHNAGNVKTSSSGVPYSTTVEFTVPEDEAKRLREEFDRQMRGGINVKK